MAAADVLLASALIGYATIAALLAFGGRVAFWGVFVSLGTLALVGGLFCHLARTPTGQPVSALRTGADLCRSLEIWIVNNRH